MKKSKGLQKSACHNEKTPKSSHFLRQQHATMKPWRAHSLERASSEWRARKLQRSLIFGSQELTTGSNTSPHRVKATEGGQWCGRNPSGKQAPLAIASCNLLSELSLIKNTIKAFSLIFIIYLVTFLERDRAKLRGYQRARVLECWFIKNLWEIKISSMNLHLFFNFCKVIMAMIN